MELLLLRPSMAENEDALKRIAEPMIRRISTCHGAEVSDEAPKRIFEIAKEGVWVDLQLSDATDHLQLEVGWVALKPTSLDREAVGEPVTKGIPQMVNVQLAGEPIREPARIHVGTDEGLEVRATIASADSSGVELAEGFNGAAQACTEAQQWTLALPTSPIIDAHAPERQEDSPLDPAAKIPKLLGLGETSKMRAVVVDPPA